MSLDALLTRAPPRAPRSACRAGSIVVPAENMYIAPLQMTSFEVYILKSGAEKVLGPHPLGRALLPSTTGGVVTDPTGFKAYMHPEYSTWHPTMRIYWVIRLNTLHKPHLGYNLLVFYTLS